MADNKFEGKSPEYIKGYEDGQRDVEFQMFKDHYYELKTNDINVTNGGEIIFARSGGVDETEYKALRKGCWELPDPEYNHEGVKLSLTGAICSSCGRYIRQPEQYCPRCGSWNRHG